MHNQYEVIGIVGEGAYGIVYKCKNKETNEFVAIKKFKETQDEIVKKTMARELRVLKILKNDNIVEYKGAFKRKDNLFLVFEYVEKNLLELLQEQPKGLNPNLIKKIIFQLCKSINYLHEQNIVHRDIKPENLLIDSTHKLKLCDFGFARTFKNCKDNLTDYVATRWYRSPELLLSSGVYGPEVDNWAIGCIMGELTDGEPLFPGDDEVHQLIVIQKVIGNFPEEMIDMFNKNPHFNGCKLPEISKPETLEKRYLGKLSKTAIAFMKQLLHPDPKYRLKGEDMLKHAYFENFNDPFPKQNSKDSLYLNSNSNTAREEPKYKETQNNINIQNNDKGSIEKTGKEPIHPTIVNKSISLGREVTLNANKPIPSHNNSLEKSNEKDYGNKSKPNQTTNINIINYNHNESNLEKFDKMEKMEKEKKKNLADLHHQQNSLSKGKITSNKQSKNFVSQENLVMTSSGFNKNMKDNILAIYGATNLDNNFKTFYKGDKYNYDIDVNFKKEERKNNSQIKDHSLNKNSHNHNQNISNSKNVNVNVKQSKYMPDKFKNNYVIPEEGYDNHNHANSKDQYNIGMNAVNKISPPKYVNNNVPYYKTKNSFYQNNVQLPSIAIKNKKGHK